MSKYFHKVRGGIDGVVNLGELFSKNINFNFSQRAWSKGEAGNDVASLVGHFYKHGDQVGAKSVAEYYQKPNDLIGAKGTHSFPDPIVNNGDMIHYNPKTHEKIVTDWSGSIRSYHIENREAYCSSQFLDKSEIR